jgi:hypothetical protein
VENLNLLTDSNRLLREERDRQLTRIKDLENDVECLEGEVGPLKETNRQLVAQKDALVAEKTALRYDTELVIWGGGVVILTRYCVIPFNAHLTCH